MEKVFLNIGPITIYWYSVLIVISIIIGVYFSSKQASKNGVGREFLNNLIFYLIPVGIIGARFYYVIFNFDIFRDDLLSIFKIWEGGLAIYGTVIFSFLFIIYYCKKHNKSVLLVIDTLIPYLLLGQAIGRWGNFINKEAHGAMTTLEYLEKLPLPSFVIEGMKINGVYYIPTFFFESILCLIGFVILLIIRKKDGFKHKGLLMFVYFIWYGIVRFFIEGMRTDSLYLGSFRVSQIVSLVLVFLGMGGLLYLLRRRKSEKV